MGNEPLAFPGAGGQEAHPGDAPSLRAGGPRESPCQSLGLGPGSCLPCIAPRGDYPETKPSSLELYGSFTSQSYSQINSISLGDSHFITSGSSQHCLPQGEAKGAAKGWKTSSWESRSTAVPGQDQLCSRAAGVTAGCILPQLSLPAWAF